MRPPKRVYIIEDDPEFGAYLLELLEDSWGGEAKLFADGLDGLRACLQDIPDVLVLDLNLPSLRGEEICRLLRSSGPHQGIRILVCSDMPEAQRREMELLALGADVYFPKPFRESDFLRDIGRLAGESIEESTRVSFRGEESTEPPITDVPSSEWERTITTIDIDESTDGLLKRFSNKTPKFEGYEMLGVIGGGAMGTVYKARQESLDRLVALKVFLRSQDDPPEYLDRFQREARIMAQLDHTNIVRVYDTGHTGYTYFIAMEFMSRGSLMQTIERHNVSWPLVRRTIDEAGKALHYLHEQSVIHRDIKPGNILVSIDGTIKLGDFGVSYARLPDESGEFTRQHTLLGTRQYMAPEILLGETATHQSDQYALGRTVLRLFEGAEPISPPRRLDSFRPETPRALADGLARMMELDPRNRFPSVGEARAALLDALPEDFDPTAASTSDS